MPGVHRLSGKAAVGSAMARGRLPFVCSQYGGAVDSTEQ